MVDGRTQSYRMQDFRNLRVWRVAHALTLDVYRATRPFPPEELYGLTSQLRRAAGSIGGNISEGAGRRTAADFAKFLHQAMGSACETLNHLMVARDLEYLTIAQFEVLENQLGAILRMLTRLIDRVRERKRRPRSRATG